MAGKKNGFHTFSEIELTFVSARVEFLYMKKAAHVAKKTIISYEGNLKPLYRFLDKQGISKVSEFSKKEFTDFRLWLQESDLSAASINTYLRNARVFLYYLMNEKKVMEPFKIHLNRQERIYKEVYTEEEIRKLIAPLTQRKVSFPEHRNWLMVCYFVETGNRLSTVINLKVEDLDLERGEAKLTTTKNRKQYTVPLGPVMVNNIRKYLQSWDLKEGDYLFPSWSRERMSDKSAQTAIARYNRSRGVQKTSAHAFRHTFSKFFTETDGNAFKLQKHLGHSTLYMTMQYVDLYGTDLRDGFEKHSLVERLTPHKIERRKKAQ